MFYHSKTRIPGQPVVELRNVSKFFGLQRESRRSIQEIFTGLFQINRAAHRPQFWPLREVSFAIQPGESVGIIGPNGSGKSTLFKLITGILEPTSGDIVLQGRISALLELGAGFHPDLTGWENIFMNGSIYGLSRREMQALADDIVEFAELGDFIDMPVKHYSSGMYVRLGFAVAIHTSPDLLLVDEVLAVGDAAFQHKCMDAIHAFRRAGGTLLLVSHDLGTIQNICDRAIWLENGEIQAQGKATDVVMGYLNHVAELEEQAKSSGKGGRRKIDNNRRWGSGEVEIVHVEFHDAAEQARSNFMTGEPITVCIHYKTAKRIADPVFGLAVYEQGGTHLSGPNTNFDEFTIPAIEGEGVIRYHIPRLILLEGGYTLSVAVHNRADTQMYDYHDRGYDFRVYPGESRERYGIVTLGGEWQLQAKTPPTPMIVANHLSEVH